MASTAVAPNAEGLVRALDAGKQVVEELLRRATQLETQFRSMQEFSELRQELAEGSGTEPSSDQQAEMQAQWCKDLLDENGEYRSVIDDMQAALDLIMKRHREQVLALVENHEQALRESAEALQHERQRNSALEKEIVTITGKMTAMAQVMCLAVDLDSKPHHLLKDAELARLRTENEGLRELLQIAGISLGGDLDTPAM